MITTLPRPSIGSTAPKAARPEYDLPIILGRGGEHFKRHHKPNVFQWAKITTSFSDYDLAGILRNDETRFIRVLIFTRPVLDGFEFSRKGEWQIVKIPRSIISDLKVLS